MPQIKADNADKKNPIIFILIRVISVNLQQKSFLLTYGIEQQWKRRQRLPAILRAEAEQDYFAFADGKFDECGFAGDLLGTERPAGEEDVFRVGWVAGDNPGRTACVSRWRARGHRRATR